MDFNNSTPIYLQVIDDIKRDIINGILPMGEKLPSGRDLAVKYKINPNTASRIYKEMEAERICYTKRGLGTYVTEDPEIITRMREEMAQNLVKHFISGMKSIGYTKEDMKRMIFEDDGEGV